MRKDDQYLFILIGVKFSHKTISRTVHDKNVYTTNLKNLFAAASKLRLQFLKYYRKLDMNKIKILRIHLEAGEADKDGSLNTFTNPLIAQNEYSIVLSLKDFIDLFQAHKNTKGVFRELKLLYGFPDDAFENKAVVSNTSTKRKQDSTATDYQEDERQINKKAKTTRRKKK